MSRYHRVPSVFGVRLTSLFTALLVLVLLLPTPSQAGSKQAFNLLSLFNRPIARVDAVLGRPSEVRDAAAGSNVQYRTYKISQGHVEVRFKQGKARAFQLWLKRPESDAARAIALIGIDVSKRKAAVDGTYRKAWRGNLGHASLKELSAANVGLHGYDLIVAKDYL